MDLSQLLNPLPETQLLVNVQLLLAALSDLEPGETSTYAPQAIYDHLQAALEYLSKPNPHTIQFNKPINPTELRSSETLSHSDEVPSDTLHVQHNIQLNRKTRLSKLFRYPLNHVLEYPETCSEKGQPVGHLFQMDPKRWYHPWLDFAYSMGAPMGRSKVEEPVYCPLLVDRSGKQVPCIERHATCECSKPYAYSATWS